MASHLKGIKKSTMTDATISNTIKRSAKYLSISDIPKDDAKRHKAAKFPELEKALYEWFVHNQERVNMSGELIVTKGKEFLKKMYPIDTPDFHFSQGWLERFKSRHGIKTYRRFGESGSVNMEVVENNLQSIREKLNQFAMKDVFNMDETGLFYRLQPDRSLATKQLEGKKQDKERLTIVICCNEDGSEKIPLWIIGKYTKPRCFKNVNLGSMDCEYRANKRAWMTGILFQEYVQQLDAKMDGRKILLIADNCPAHPKNIEGIIRAFKMHYRRRFYRNILEGFEIGNPNPEKINVLEAMNLAISAWKIDVHSSTIANCFRHCKLRLPDDVLNYPGENDTSLELPTDEQIIESVMESNKEDEVEDDSVELEQVSRKDALKAA
uniref:CENP-B homolog protein 2-like n=1 Tax=Cyanistes caeruleus TaxID=156563 RepID=A0A8C0Z9I1_CYACU